MLIERERNLLTLEEQRVRSLETQATAILGLVVALAAFGASALDAKTLAQHTAPITVVVVLLIVAASFAVGARGPRAVHARFWHKLLPEYARREERVRRAEAAVQASRSDTRALYGAVLESWQARTAVTNYLAENKALWVTCSLFSLLVAFIVAGVATLVILG
jgi:hypothetical protein